MKLSLFNAIAIVLCMSLAAQDHMAIRRNQVGNYPLQEKVIVVEGINPQGQLKVTDAAGKVVKTKRCRPGRANVATWWIWAR